MRHDVLISDEVCALLRDLQRSDPGAANSVTWSLLSLRSNPRPRGSRELAPLDDPVLGGRVWIHDTGVEVVCQLDDEDRVVRVATIALPASRG